MAERNLDILALFSLERPIWSAESIAGELGVSISSAYRSIARLEALGFLSAARPGQYVLGPAIIQYDRQIQLTDPLLGASRPFMQALADLAPPGSVTLLCRSFGETVLCVHQVQGPGQPGKASYERGRPMPLFRGAASKIILAYAPLRILKRLYERHAAEIASGGLGGDWAEFRAALARLRKAGTVVTSSEVDQGRTGIAAPILDQDRRVIGSLSYVIDEAHFEERLVTRLASIVADTAREVEQAIRATE
jgi:DNA-binding IclR family transcriptional regulator